MNVKFPAVAGGLPASFLQRYYKVYYEYVLKCFQYTGAAIEKGPDSSIGDARFLVEIDGYPFVIDYSDHLTLVDNYMDFSCYFKFHYSEGVHEMYKNLFPFSPVSFYDWDEYFFLEKNIHYTCSGRTIINMQKPHGNALTRRKEVQRKLVEWYGNEVITTIAAQGDFWRRINNCLVSVCVPGSRNNMLDRGQLQYMAFGACTISPYLITMLPGFRRLESGVHYIVCRDDYGDLQDKIEWCRMNPALCVEIGRNAKALFRETSTPGAIRHWVNQCMYA